MLILENGSGLQDANAYISIDFADDFFADRGLDDELLVYNAALDSKIQAWVGTVSQKEAAIIRATDHIDAVYAIHFVESRLTATQALAWPRTSFNGLPLILKKATALYALRALQGTLIPDPKQASSTVDIQVTGGIKRKREKLGPLEEETEYVTAGDASRNSQVIYFHEVLTPVSYPEADLMLQPLLKPEAIISPSHPASTDTCPKGAFGTGSTIR